MGCSSCGQRAAQAAKYPREAVMPDGTKIMVSSAAQERTELAKYRQREREINRGRGYTFERG